MKAAIVLWENWRQQVKQLLAGLHGHQQKTLALCVLGIVLSGSAPTHGRELAATRHQ